MYEKIREEIEGKCLKRLGKRLKVNVQIDWEKIKG